MGFVSNVKIFVAYWYLQWELYTAIYMMEPTEKVIIHGVFMAIVALALYTAYSYVPGQIVMIASLLTRTG